MNEAILREKPFYLDDEKVRWVEETLSGMSVKEKAGQLFCVNALDCTEQTLEKIFRILEPAAVMYRPNTPEAALACTHWLSEHAKIPLLISGNLEKGGNGMVEGGTQLSTPMGLAATGDVTTAEKLGTVCAREGAAIGANWAFGPVIDIDYNWRNPITNTRTFGSNPDTVAAFGAAYVRSLQNGSFAACIKHFPGDGRDERDQHLCTTVNDLDCETWMGTYGKVYKTCIDAGALTCMAGQIMQPAWSKRLNPALKDEDIKPASQSKELIQGLLRGELGFNGLICTDATTMAGYLVPGPRKETLPGSIAAGIDMILFNKNLEEDFGYVLDAIESGVISEERLDEAVMRVLAVKAAIGLNEKRAVPTMEALTKVVGCTEHRSWERDIADRSITLVKEEKGVLPITPEKYPRILLYPLDAEFDSAFGGYGTRQGIADNIAGRLRAEGFTVSLYERDPGLEGFTRTMKSYTDQYDLCLYVANLATKSNQTVVRLEWAQPMGANCPHFITSIPTIFVSLENPYHLVDVPRIRTFINTYASTDAVLDKLIDKLVGRSTFKGVSPSDPFCGLWDTHL